MFYEDGRVTEINFTIHPEKPSFEDKGDTASAEGVLESQHYTLLN